MKLMNVDEYRETYYTKKSQPSKRTLIKLVKEGELPGRKLGKCYYIDIETASKLTGNVLVDRVLMQG